MSSGQRSRRPEFRVPVLALVMVLALVPAQRQALAGTLTWDADNVTSGPQDGGGNWDTTSMQWWDGVSDVVWDNVTPGAAIFGVGDGAAGTVNLGTGINTGNLTFNTPGSGSYVISGNMLTLVGSPVITVNAGGDATIGSYLAGTAFTKEGSGVLTLNPSGSESFTGTTFINNGTVMVGGNDTYVYINGDLQVNPGGVFAYRSGGSGGPMLPTATLIVNGGTVSNVVSSKNFYINKIILANDGTLDAVPNAYCNPTNFDARSGRNFFSRYRGAITLAKSTAGSECMYIPELVRKSRGTHLELRGSAYARRGAPDRSQAGGDRYAVVTVRAVVPPPALCGPPDKP